MLEGSASRICESIFICLPGGMSGISGMPGASFFLAQAGTFRPMQTSSGVAVVSQVLCTSATLNKRIKRYRIYTVSSICIVNEFKKFIYDTCSAGMRTDADWNYAASRPASGAGNAAKRKRFVRFL